MRLLLHSFLFFTCCVAALTVAGQSFVDATKNRVAANPQLTLIDEWKKNDQLSGDSLYKLLSGWNRYTRPAKTGVICEYSTRLDTNYTVPYFVYIPRNYDPARKTVLLVYYKGGWLSRKALPENYATEMISDNPALAYLDQYNIIELFPALEARLAIFGYYGYQHLQQMVAQAKKIFNTDDNKVFLAGFSDGGATVYNAAYLSATPFAGFYGINGSIVSRPYYANLTSRPVYSFVAEKDQVFDRRSVLTKAAFANKLGANWVYRELPGRNHFYHPYQQEVLPVLFEHLQTSYRQPLPSSIIYHRGFNDSAAIPGIDWLQMQVNTKLAPAAFHFTDSIVTVNGSGEESSYIYGGNTGQVRAHYFNNCFTIEASQVEGIEIRISPLMVNMQLPVKVIVNGKELYNAPVPYDKNYMVANFLRHFDRQQVWINRIVLKW